MDRINEEFCELLDDQLKTIVKKGDISPTEMENAYRAIKSKYYLTVMDEMKEAKEQGYSQRGGNGYSGGYSYRNDSYDYGNARDYSGARRGRDGDGDGRYSEDGNSNRRGRDAMGRYTSRDSYDNYSRHDEKEQLRQNIEEMKRKLDRMN